MQTQWSRSYNTDYDNKYYTILQIYSTVVVTNQIVQTLVPQLIALPPKYPVQYDNLEKCLIAQNGSLCSIKFGSAGALTFQQQKECKHSNVCQVPSMWHRKVGLTVLKTNVPM